jgi:hypothetical protein
MKVVLLEMQTKKVERDRRSMNMCYIISPLPTQSGNSWKVLFASTIELMSHMLCKSTLTFLCF